MKYILVGIVMAIAITVGVTGSAQGCVISPTTAQIRAGEATSLGYGGYKPSKTQLTLCKQSKPVYPVLHETNPALQGSSPKLQGN